MTEQEVKDICDIAQLIYGKWSDAATALNAVKKETDDGSPDWNDFHETRLEIAKAEEDHWHAFVTRYTNEHRGTINKAYGI